MNRSEARTMVEELAKLGTRTHAVHATLGHRGWYDKLTPDVENDGGWHVEVKVVSNRSLRSHSEYTETFMSATKDLKAFVKKAKEGLDALNTRIRVGKSLGY